MEEKLEVLLESNNIAENLDEDKLTEIGQAAKAGFESDLASRSDWDKAMEDWIKLAKQLAEPKTYPWRNASNVKYPLLSTAAMQFAARAYPSLVPSDRRVVKAKPIGKDLDGQKTQVAEAISIYMSYQLMEEMEGWEEDMDKLLIMLPIVGVMFKKTYWDSVKQINCSRIVLPKNLVVDYWTKSLSEAERISEIIELSPRKVKERQQSGIWLDVELGKATTPEGVMNAPVEDSTTPHQFVEQHTFIDLDDDEYEEPYIVTFQRTSGKVVRIVARYDQHTMYTDKSTGELQKIEPIQYYTKFGFVPNPDGSFYDIGFGVLLGPLNESVNTLINQLIDAGHMSSLQSGFIGKGLRLRAGETEFKPNEWKVVNAMGTDLKQQIVPLPTKEPSKVLFELMGALITSGKELASVAEIFVGKMPGQNTPATTTMATIEQGMKVFTAVYKRIYRSLAEEFQKLYRLNSLYLQPDTYVDVVDMNLQAELFDVKQNNVFPGADPTAISQTERLLKAQGLMELLPSGALDPVKVVKRILEAQEQPNWEELLLPQVAQSGQLPPKQDPKLQEMQMKGELEQRKFQLQAQGQAQKSELAARDQQTKLAMKAQEHQMTMQQKAQELQLNSAIETHKQRVFSAEAQQKMNLQAAQGSLKVQQTKEMGDAKVAAARQQAKAKPTKGPKKAK
jgi:chaperonin GroES